MEVEKNEENDLKIKINTNFNNIKKEVEDSEIDNNNFKITFNAKQISDVKYKNLLTTTLHNNMELTLYEMQLLDNYEKLKAHQVL